MGPGGIVGLGNSLVPSSEPNNCDQMSTLMFLLPKSAGVTNVRNRLSHWSQMTFRKYMYNLRTHHSEQ